MLKINVLGKVEEYEIIRKIKFTSDRKRMSVIVKNMQTDSYQCFTKGADIAIL